MKRLIKGRVRGHGLVCGCLAAVLTAAGLPGAGPGTASAEGGSVGWNNGLEYKAADGTFQFKVGGRLHADWAWLGGGDSLKAVAGGFEDGAEIRRARMFISGLLYENVEFKVQVDFAGGEVAFKDAYLGLNDFPFGTLQVGQQHVSQALETTTSSNYITFLERALPSVLDPGRQVAIKALNHSKDQNMTWSATLYRPMTGEGQAVGDGRYGIAARITALAAEDKEEGSLVHLGVSALHEFGDAAFSLSQRPEAHLAPKLVKTGSVATDGVTMIKGEAATIQKQFHAHGELSLMNVSAVSGDSEWITGFFAQVGYFLTEGDHRGYKKSEGVFDRVKPSKAYGRPGNGAVEIAARFSRLDFTNLAEGQALNDLTLGVNWYLNPNTRIMANFVHAGVKDSDSANIVESRFQVDF